MVDRAQSRARRRLRRRGQSFFLRLTLSAVIVSGPARSGVRRWTYREALGLLCNDAEGTYFLHRFTDPTFVTAEAVLRAIGQQRWPMQSRTLDLCGGSGHLTRVLTGLGPPGEALVPSTVLADVYFWKLWLASRFTAPDSGPVCCDANHPLPFAPGTFSTVVLADAFPYIWHKRLLAEEMMRLADAHGVLVMPHLH